MTDGIAPDPLASPARILVVEDDDNIATAL